MDGLGGSLKHCKLGRMLKSEVDHRCLGVQYNWTLSRLTVSNISPSQRVAVDPEKLDHPWDWPMHRETARGGGFHR